MAITKIWKIRSRLDRKINYIANPEKTTMKPDIEAVEGTIKYIKNKDKTENCVYVKSYNCSTDTPYDDMIETQDRFGKRRRKTVCLLII